MGSLIIQQQKSETGIEAQNKYQIIFSNETMVSPLANAGAAKSDGGKVIFSIQKFQETTPYGFSTTFESHANNKRWTFSQSTDSDYREMYVRVSAEGVTKRSDLFKGMKCSGTVTQW